MSKRKPMSMTLEAGLRSIDEGITAAVKHERTEAAIRALEGAMYAPMLAEDRTVTTREVRQMLQARMRLTKEGTIIV